MSPLDHLTKRQLKKGLDLELIMSGGFFLVTPIMPHMESLITSILEQILKTSAELRMKSINEPEFVALSQLDAARLDDELKEYNYFRFHADPLKYPDERIYGLKLLRPIRAIPVSPAVL